MCVRSGVIQTLQQVYCFDKRHHFTEKRKTRNTHTQAALRSSVKLDKSEIYKANVCHIANDNTRKRFLEQKKNIAAKIKERKERYVFTMSPGFVSVPL